MPLCMFICLHETRQNVNILFLFHKKTTEQKSKNFSRTIVMLKEEAATDIVWEGCLSLGNLVECRKFC